jgi:hypothetical protein
MEQCLVAHSASFSPLQFLLPLKLVGISNHVHFLAMNSENEKSVRWLDNICIYESLSKFDFFIQAHRTCYLATGTIIGAYQYSPTAISREMRSASLNKEASILASPKVVAR